MEVMLLRLFQREVQRQCDFALTAAGDIEQAKRSLVEARDEIRLLALGSRQFRRMEQQEGAAEDRLWYSLQNFLVASALVSRMMWPCQPGRGKKRLVEERAEELRTSLGMTDDSPLKARVLRDHLEHFDERLEEWFTTTNTRTFADALVGTVHKLEEINDRDRLRYFDPDRMVVEFRGDRFELIPLLAAVRTIREAAAVEVSKGIPGFRTIQLVGDVRIDRPA